MTRELFEHLAAGGTLSADAAAAVMGSIMDGEATPSQIGALLMALTLRGETVDELAGFARAMRARATAVPVRRRPVLDTCGTGGDGSGSLNVSTLAAFVAAAAGIPVAKHGNRSVSSRSGSADLLEALGIPMPTDPEAVGRLVDERGFAFLFAPAFHPSMRHAMPTRRELGIRTVFNLLGPLTNPAGAERQLLGVYASRWVEPVARVLSQLGTERALVVHGNGWDEVALTGPTVVAEVDGPTVRTYEVTPEQFGFRRVHPDQLRGGDPATNARLAEAVLEGEPGPLADFVALNGGFALYAGGAVPSPAAGVAEARRLLQSGAVARLVRTLRDGGARP
ncbi:MAG: anthranilate phosphoribosyltransferase [Actinomycetia bacterium]|nr:anthranilate phosphoribosyltransferase [Actinomycetes bacterium]